MQRRQRVAAILATALVLAACSGGLDTETSDPPERAAEPEPGARSDREAGEELGADVPEIFRGQLYPPLPDRQSRRSGADLEVREQVFAIHRDLYDLELSALATNDADEEPLAQLATPEHVQGLLDELEGQREAASVSVNPDGSIPWVDVTLSDRREAVVSQCVVLGPLAGGYDVESGEPTFDEADSRELEVVQTYTYRADADAPRGWYAVDFTSEPTVGCSTR